MTAGFQLADDSATWGPHMLDYDFHHSLDLAAKY